VRFLAKSDLEQSMPMVLWPMAALVQMVGSETD
jgi:hypothetical protein